MFEPLTEVMKLNQNIKMLNQLLNRYGEKSWKLGEVHSAASAKRVLMSFGGMGSINDLYICQANGHKIDPSQEQEVNFELHRLLRLIAQACEEKAR